MSTCVRVVQQFTDMTDESWTQTFIKRLTSNFGRFWPKVEIGCEVHIREGLSWHRPRDTGGTERKTWAQCVVV